MIKDTVRTVRKLLLLEERVRQLSERVERQDAQLLDYRDRLVRVEVVLEYTAARPANTLLPDNREGSE